MKTLIPSPVIAALSEVLAISETHASLDNLFMHAGAPGEPPVGSKPVKVQEWLRRVNRDESLIPLEVLGRLIEDIMESEDVYRQEAKQKIQKALARYDLRYVQGGIVSSGLGAPSKSLEDLIRAKSLEALGEEFSRALKNVEANPREAVSAACNILESACKVYIEDEKLEKPAKQDLQGLWQVVRRDLGFDPGAVEDQDLKQILSGLLGIVGGIGALRTHASSAHGAGRSSYRLEARHARLAVHAAHTVVVFILESWQKKRSAREP